MKFLFKWISYSVLGILFSIVIVGGVGIGGLYYFGKDLPNHHYLTKYQPNVSSSVFLSDGSLLKEFAFEKRHFTPIEEIPEVLKNAFLAAEDRNFYEHAGIDPIGIIRSFFHNIINLGTNKRPQGASTITQQVARIFLVGSNELSYIRKIKEAILAFRIEHLLPKGKILELYLNQIYLGASTYGVSAAAKRYFNKSLEQLTIEECALLASLAKGASYYNPIKYHNRALARRNWVIKRMFDTGLISENEMLVALKTDVKVVANKPDNEQVADYYAEEVRKSISNTLSVESINKEGLVIRVPLNIKYQKAAEEALRDGLEKLDRQYGWRGAITNLKYNEKTFLNDIKKIEFPHGSEKFEHGIVTNISNSSVTVRTTDNENLFLAQDDITWTKNSKHKLSVGDIILFKRNKNLAELKQIPIVQGAIVAMEPNSGKVLAMHGGYDYNISNFNRATQAMRQPGSCFKPFVYLTALEAGYSPASIIDGRQVTIDLGNGVGYWTPKNFKNKLVEDVTLRTGLEKSLNTVTVRIAQLVGLESIISTVEKFDIFEKVPKIWSIVLGASETTLIKLVTAYSEIANGGYKISPVFIEQIKDKFGKTIYRNDYLSTEILNIGPNITEPPAVIDDRLQIIDSRSAYQTISLMCGSVLRGTSGRARQLNIPLAGKTGTSNDSKDNWFIGCTPNIVVGVLVCFDDSTKSLGENAVGATTALPIFIDFMKRAGLNKHKIPFKVPAGIIFKNINRVTGKKCSPTDPEVISEAFKEDDNFTEIINQTEDKNVGHPLSEEKTNTESNLEGIY